MAIGKVQYPLEIMQKIAAAGCIAAMVSLFLGGILHNWQLSGSLLSGILLWMLPSCYLANKLFRHLGKVRPVSLLRIFYRAEINKLLLSGIFFVMMIKLIPINIPAFVIGYFIPQLFFWLRLIIKGKEVLV